MGNDQNVLTKLLTDHKKKTAVLSGVVALIGTILFLMWVFKDRKPTAEKILKWDDVAYIDDQGNAKLKPERIQEIQRKLKEFDEAEQYVLLARTDGWYSCPHCSKGSYYLKAGEVAKYGVTRKGESKRYDADYIERMDMEYRVQFRGNYAECLKAELAQIAKYPLLPENLKRQKRLRLARPILNQTDY